MDPDGINQLITGEESVELAAVHKRRESSFRFLNAFVALARWYVRPQTKAQLSPRY